MSMNIIPVQVFSSEPEMLQPSLTKTSETSSLVYSQVHRLVLPTKQHTLRLNTYERVMSS